MLWLLRIGSDEIDKAIGDLGEGAKAGQAASFARGYALEDLRHEVVDAAADVAGSMRTSGQSVFSARERSMASTWR